MSATDDRAARIEKLLDEVQATAGPVAWPRVESLITALVELYGAGIERVVTMARESARDSAELDQLLLKDDLVSSLLVLHDLHPAADASDLEIKKPPTKQPQLIEASRLARGARP
jgi:hypothetical protein